MVINSVPVATTHLIVEELGNGLGIALDDAVLDQPLHALARVAVEVVNANALDALNLCLEIKGGKKRGKGDGKQSSID